MLTTLKKGYYLGIDGGGTKTHAVITDETGFVLGEGVSAGSNPHNVPIHEAIENIQSAIDKAKDKVAKKRRNIVPELIIFDGACLGLAGLDTDADREHVILGLKELKKKDQTFGAKKLIMVNDGLIGLKSGTDKNYGICLIAGTGSNCYGLTPGGKEAVAGDWGFVLGDQGSAYAMGRAILQQVLKEYDGRIPKTTLTNAVLKFLNLESVSDLVTWTYRGHIPVRGIATLPQMFNDISLSDSIEVSNIINMGVTELVLAFEAVHRALKFDSDAEIDVVLLGGLFKMQGQFTDKVIRSILNRNLNANVVFPTKTPGEGAAKVARLLAQKFDLYPDSAYIFVNSKLK